MQRNALRGGAGSSKKAAASYRAISQVVMKSQQSWVGVAMDAAMFEMAVSNKSNGERVVRAVWINAGSLSASRSLMMQSEPC